MYDRFFTRNHVTSEMYDLQLDVLDFGLQLGYYRCPKRCDDYLEYVGKINYRFEDVLEALRINSDGSATDAVAARYLVHGARLMEELDQMLQGMNHDSVLVTKLFDLCVPMYLPRCLMPYSKFQNSDEMAVVDRWSRGSELKDFVEWRETIAEAETFIKEAPDVITVLTLRLVESGQQPEVILEDPVSLRKRRSYRYDDA